MRVGQKWAPSSALLWRSMASCTEKSVLSYIIWFNRNWQPCRFPRRLPLDQHPPLYRSIVGGQRCPLYGLAWVCSGRQLDENLGEVGDYRDVIAFRWKGPFRCAPSPLDWPANWLILTIVMTCHPESSLRMGIIISSPYGMNLILVIQRKPSLKRREWRLV